MKRVTGIGGIFFKSKDPAALRDWYRTHLGIPCEDWGAQFAWRTLDGKDASTVWSPFAADTKYFEPSEKPFMINYRVDDLDAVLAALRAEGVTVDDKIEDSDFGRFARGMDPDGNRFELWQPPASKS